jgi:hypothetical protein
MALRQIRDFAARQAAGVAEPAKTLEKPWPWLFWVEHWLFGQWQLVDEGTVRCPHCGSEPVARKTRKPRLKAYLDEQGQRQTVEVYRDYCKNPDCPFKTFTRLRRAAQPDRLFGLDAGRAREGVGTVCRAAHQLSRRGECLGRGSLHSVSLAGAIRGGTAPGGGPVWPGAQFRRGGDRRKVRQGAQEQQTGRQAAQVDVRAKRVAVDVHTLDLLHIHLFPNLGKDSARTFLLELRAKGYHPRVIVTDMNQDYTEPLAAVFPNAIHHECIFHALQYWHRYFKTAFGRDYERTHPNLFRLRQQVDRVFQPKTRRTIEKRHDSIARNRVRRAYAELMAQRDQLLQAEPRLEAIFDSLTRHYPTLVNAYDNALIPLTNNATERLIRRLDQLPKLCRLRFPRDGALLPTLVRVDLSLHAVRPRGAAASMQQVSARTGGVRLDAGAAGALSA